MSFPFFLMGSLREPTQKVVYRFHGVGLRRPAETNSGSTRDSLSFKHTILHIPTPPPFSTFRLLHFPTHPHLAFPSSSKFQVSRGVGGSLKGEGNFYKGFP